MLFLSAWFGGCSVKNDDGDSADDDEPAGGEMSSGGTAPGGTSGGGAPSSGKNAGGKSGEGGEISESGGPGAGTDGGNEAGAGGTSGPGSAGSGGDAGESGNAGSGGSGPEVSGGTTGEGGDGGGGTTGIVPGVTAGTTGPLLIHVTTATDPAIPGERLLYTITVNNASTHVVDGVAVLLRVPTGIRFHYINDTAPNTACGAVSCAANAEAKWTLGSIGAGESRSIDVNAEVLETLGDGDEIRTPVRITAMDVNELDLVKTVHVYGKPSSQLALGSSAGPTMPGRTLTLDLDVGQVGTSALSGAELQAFLPSGLTSTKISDGGIKTTIESREVIAWPIGAVAVGSGVQRKVEVQVADGVGAGEILTTRAELTHEGGVDVDGAAEYPISIAPNPPALAYDLVVMRAPAVPGGRMSLMATVSNLSTRAVDTIALMMRLPPGIAIHYTNGAAPDSSCGAVSCGADSELGWTLGTLAAGATQNFLLSAEIVATEVGDGNLLSIPAFMTAAGVSEVRARTNLHVYTQPGAQLALGSGVDPVEPGQTFTLNLDIGQIGAAALAGTTLKAYLPTGVGVGSISNGGTQPEPGMVSWNVGTIAVGASVHREVALTVDADVPSGTTLHTRSELTYDGGLPVDASAESSVTVVRSPSPLKLTVTTTPSIATPGERLEYKLAVTNTSARAVDGVTVLQRSPVGVQFHYTNDAEPNTSCGAVTCSASTEAVWGLGSIAAGATQTITVNALVAATVTAGSLISTTSQLTATGLMDVISVQTTVPTGG